jgi:tetratricopeptide (TPR) repeat protein
MRFFPAFISAFPRQRLFALCCAIVCMVAFAQSARAQRAAWHDDRFSFRRTVTLPHDAPPPKVVVVDFFAHGQLHADGGNLAVFGRRGAVPFRVLQTGPGDYCRVAFQTENGAPHYHVYYGGNIAAEEIERPRWTATEGLLMETRRCQDGAPRDLESLQNAFIASPRIGADYVPGVDHRRNPFAAAPGPFLTRYVGMIHVPLTGRVAFFTSGRDASFLLIDGKLVAEASGRSLAGGKGEIDLDAGPHRFEYWHAARGAEASMEAAWALPGLDKPAPMAPSVFGHDKIAHLTAEQLEHRTERYLPDFRMAVVGIAPGADDYQPAMVRVQLVDRTAPAITRNAKYTWEFSDGRTCEGANPAHLFLRPGLHQVKMTVRRGTSEWTTIHRVPIDASQEAAAASAEADSPLAEALDRYNAQNLDPAGLTEMVRAYLQVKDWRNAVNLGRAAFTPEAVEHTDETRWMLVRMLGPVLRHELLDAAGAAELFRDAAALIEHREWRGACALEAADCYLNDALDAAEAGPLLASVVEEQVFLPPVLIGRMHRLLGDWSARAGDGKTARAEYAKAAGYLTASLAAEHDFGAAAERLLRERELRRLRIELDRWQNASPPEKAEGRWSLAMMGYWIAHAKYPQALAVGSDLLTVNAQSPYAQRVLYLVALCQGKLDQKPQAAAALQTLLKAHPQGALAVAAEAQRARLQEGKKLDYRSLTPRDAAPRTAKDLEP